MSSHPWSRDPVAQAAVRAAEDAAAAERTPLPDHRELPAAVAELRERVGRLEAAAKLAPAANAGGEANQPWPMAFAVWGRGAVCGVSVSREDAGAMQREFAFDTEVMPLYAAPQPPRGWLTEEERAWLTDTFDQCRKNIDARLDEGNEEGAKIVSITCARLRALLARSTPPRVRRPQLQDHLLTQAQRDRDDVWIAAIREAGGEVG